MTAAGIAAELPALVDLLAAGTLSVATLPIPLAQIERAWATPTEPGQRTVLIP